LKQKTFRSLMAYCIANAYKEVVMKFKSLFNVVFLCLSAKIALPDCIDLITYKARIIIKYYDCIYCGRNNPICKFHPRGAVLEELSGSATYLIMSRKLYDFRKTWIENNAADGSIINVRMSSTKLQFSRFWPDFSLIPQILVKNPITKSHVKRSADAKLFHVEKRMDRDTGSHGDNIGIAQLCERD
jgi:hypothetical protein